MVKRWKVINCHSLSIRTPSVGNGCKRNSAKLQQPRWNLFFPTLITWFSTPVACIPFPWYSIFLFVFLVLLSCSPTHASPSPAGLHTRAPHHLVQMKILERKNNFVNVASSALVVFSILIIFTCNYRERGALAISNSLPWHHMRAEVHVAVVIIICRKVS